MHHIQRGHHERLYWLSHAKSRLNQIINLQIFFEILENGLILSYREKPVEIMWGMKDVAWSPRVLEEEWTRILPNAVIKKVEDAGHFIQEDAYEIIVPELLQFLKKLNG